MLDDLLDRNKKRILSNIQKNSHALGAHGPEQIGFGSDGQWMLRMDDPDPTCPRQI